MSDPTHHTYCKNEKEIGRLIAEVDTLNGIVMKKGGLAQTVPVLSQNVSTLTETISNLTTGVSGLLKFQENQLGQEKGKETIRKRNRWLTGIIITILVAFAGILIGINFGS